MKTKLSMLGVVLVLGLSTFLDNPPNPSGNTMYYNFGIEESVDVEAQNVQRSASYSYEFLLDDMKEMDDYIIETYREYKVHKDADGNVISRIPTSNYQYLKYEK